MTKDPKRLERQAEIEEAAYALLATKGGKATSMLEVAKRARASNQTLYRWYGDKNGLFLAMVESNAARAAQMLQAALAGQQDLDALLETLGPTLLDIILSDRAVALNRAAAASAHDDQTLGKAIATGGRQAIAALLSSVIQKAYPKADGQVGADIYLDLLVGDAQIKRVVGAEATVSAPQVAARAKRAGAVLKTWLLAQN